MGPDQDYKDPLRNLTNIFDTTVKSIFESVDSCPLVLRQIFLQIRNAATQKFPEDEEVGYTAVTGFVFLRFFVPAVMVRVYKLTRNFELT